MGSFVKPVAVIFDIDGTISDMEYRKHLITGKCSAATMKKNWEEFYKQSIDDTQIDGPMELLRTFLNSHTPIFFCTGRQESNREITCRWLYRFDIYVGMGSTLLMRKEGDRRGGFEIKLDMLKEVQKTHRVILAVDNDEEAIEMYKQAKVLGVLCGNIVKKGEDSYDKYGI